MASDAAIAFAPTGRTIVVPAAAVAPTGVQAAVPTSYNNQDAGQYRIVNAGAVIVHIGVGSTAAQATANAVAAVAGTGQFSIPILPNAVEVLRFAPGSFFSGIASAAATVYVTPGQGL